MEKKPSKIDKANALVRIPEYLKELDAYRKSPTPKKRNDLCNKWGLLTPITPESVQRLEHPEDPNNYPKGKALPVDLIRDKKGNLKFSKQLEKRKTREIERAPIFKHTPWSWKITVDLNQPLSESLFLAQKDIEALYWIVEEYRPKKSKERERELTYSPWLVYDLHTKDRLNRHKIAKKLSGLKGNASIDNPTLMAHYKAVNRALDRAEEIIKYVRLQIPNPDISIQDKKKKIMDFVREVMSDLPV
jgi:hypothetical protein